MIFGKKNQLIGLDIGSRCIKAAEALETKRGWVLRRFGTIDIAPGAIEEGLIKEPQVVSDAIRELFGLYNFKTKNVAISIGGYSVIVKNITVQNMPEEQLYESLNFEAEQYIPFDINDVNNMDISKLTTKNQDRLKMATLNIMDEIVIRTDGLYTPPEFKIFTPFRKLGYLFLTFPFTVYETLVKLGLLSPFSYSSTHKAFTSSAELTGIKHNHP